MIHRFLLQQSRDPFMSSRMEVDVSDWTSNMLGFALLVCMSAAVSKKKKKEKTNTQRDRPNDRYGSKRPRSATLHIFLHPKFYFSYTDLLVTTQFGGSCVYFQLYCTIVPLRCVRNGFQYFGRPDEQFWGRPSDRVPICDRWMDHPNICLRGGRFACVGRCVDGIGATLRAVTLAEVSVACLFQKMQGVDGTPRDSPRYGCSSLA